MRGKGKGSLTLSPQSRSLFPFLPTALSLSAPANGLPHKRLLNRVVKFPSHCSQISAGAQVQIIGEPTGAVEVKVLTSQTHTFKLGNLL